MNRSDRVLVLLLGFTTVNLGGGCSPGASRVHQPSLSPRHAAAQAIADYDSSGDGLLDAREIAASPGLMAAIQQFDRDGDSRISKAEIAGRLDEWVTSRTAVFAVPCSITLDGRQVVGAKVRFEPEPFLGDAFHVIEATTNQDGEVLLPKLEEIPIRGFPLGLYRVRVSKTVNAQETIPAKYNKQTILGQEIADGAAGMGSGIFLRLTSK